YYNKATQNGLKMHFKLIAEAIHVPVILYNVPSRTGCNIQPETAVWLARNVENIVAIKEASGNISQIGHLFAIANGDIDVYSGNDDQIVPLLSLGGKGVISVLSNIAPRQTHEIVQKYHDGDVAGSAKMQLEAMNLINALFCEVNPIPVKKASELMNLCGGGVRLPLTEIEAANAERLANAMRDYGLLD
ncbi:MAG: dihydrodipicolinate synthase family protein, partial [Peptococcaceae bacterium]|nr:dihydrodipicolinate synthase family protein [Peptococcaceae bacterium]